MRIQTAATTARRANETKAINSAQCYDTSRRHRRFGTFVASISRITIRDTAPEPVVDALKEALR